LDSCPPKAAGGDDRLKTVLKALADEPKPASCGCEAEDSCGAGKDAGKKAGKEAKKAVDKAMKKVEDK